MERIVLVNKQDKEIGIGEKIKVHQEGKLHRSFSIFIFNSKRELLIQQRAKSKYHSALLWSNTCCSHPRPNEKLIEAAKRRLKEEMGIRCNLKEIFSFIYKTKVGNLGEEDKSSSSRLAKARLIEHEFDHVFFGKFDGNPIPNPKEVEDWRWISLNELKKEIKKNPQKYTPWFKIFLKRVFKQWGKI